MVLPILPGVHIGFVIFAVVAPPLYKKITWGALQTVCHGGEETQEFQAADVKVVQ